MKIRLTCSISARWTRNLTSRARFTSAGESRAFCRTETTRPASLTSLSYVKGYTAVNAAIAGAGKDGAIDLDNAGLRPVTVVMDLTSSYYAYPG
jgi:hypothetical protein